MANDPIVTDNTVPRSQRGVRFSSIFAAICVALFLSALELTAVSTALPTIAHDLHAVDFVWVGSAYTLSSTAFLPMSGGLAQMFGRRPAFLFSLAVFALGPSRVSVVEAFIQSLSAIVLADMVTLQERGVFASFFGLTWSVAGLIGPVVGGTLADNGQWRWLFYLNLPICGVAAILVAVFMNLPTPPGTFSDKFMRLDWTGNALIITGTTAVTIALTWGGVTAPWRSAQVLGPLIIGIILLCFFLVWEACFASHPLAPSSLLSNRTSVSGYLQTFFVGIVALGIVYYMPIFYQGCKDASPLRSGVLALGFASLAPAALVAGALVNRLQRYCPQMWAGWTIILIGLGLHTTLAADTPVGRAVGFGVLTGVGIGFEYSTTVFPVQAPLPVTQNAPAIAFLQFLRSFAGVWGITIGAAVLQNELTSRIPAPFLQDFPQGAAIAYAIIPSVPGLPQPLKEGVQVAFADSLQVVWQVFLGIGGIGFLASLAMKGLPLPAELDKNWAPSAEKEGANAEVESKIEEEVVTAA